MKRLAVMSAVVAALAFTGSALAGGGTGITATAASTKSFDAGSCSATFVRAASGIINETSRTCAGAQNPWSPYDVWLQFRPLTGPSGTGSPTPNPACSGSTVTAPFTFVNSESSISGTTASGYFIGSNPYNVCVYYVNPFVLTLAGDGETSLAVEAGHEITYSGTFSNGSVGIASTPVSLNVYNSTGCVSSNLLYPNISAGSTDGSGAYSLHAGPSPLGVYSVDATATDAVSGVTATSNCIDVYVGETAVVNDVTSSPATTWDCATGATGGTATSSTVYWYRDQTTGVVRAQITVVGAEANSTFDVWVEQNPGTCPPGTSSPSNPVALTTDADGDGSATISFTPVAGATSFWLSMWTPTGSLTGEQVLRSEAVTLS